MKLEAFQASTPNRLLLVDGHAYAYRAFFAIRKLSSPTGQPTNAIYGFINMLNGLVADLQPAGLCVVWDGGLSGARTNLLPQYKAQRPSMPDDLRVQFDPLVDYLHAAGIESFCQDAIEADDYIACLATKAARTGFITVIASADKDFMQLVSPEILVYNPRENQKDLMGPDEVVHKTGVQPRQIVDWLSLIGDSVDNIPGVQGIGPKTATELLVAFDSIDGIYERLTEVGSDRLKAALGASKDTLYMNRKLIRLHSEIECDFSHARFSRRKRDLQALRSLYQAWGFKKLLAQLDSESQSTPELALR